MIMIWCLDQACHLNILELGGIILYLSIMTPMNPMQFQIEDFYLNKEDIA